jgi:prepilin-type N-terminal cleavage/methylation domain-containing protein
MKNQGFTLIELIVVMGIVGTLAAFMTTNLMGFQRHTHIATTISTVLADWYAQRSRSMIGDTQGRSSADAYGIYFQTGRYTLFHGASYNPSSPDNVVIPLESPVQVSSTTLPGSTVIFTKGSGEVTGYSGSQNTISFTNSSSNEVVTLTFNQYGTITSDLP